MVDPPPYTTVVQAMAFLDNVGRSRDNIAHAGTDMAFFEGKVRSNFASRSVMQSAVELLVYVWPSCVPWGSTPPSWNVVRYLICCAVSGVGHYYGEDALRQSDNLRLACAVADDARVAILAAVEQTLFARPGFKDSGYRYGGGPDTPDGRWCAYRSACVHLVVRTKALIVAQWEARVQFEAWESGQTGPAVFAAACGGFPLSKGLIKLVLGYAPADEEILRKAMGGMHRHAMGEKKTSRSSPPVDEAIEAADIARTELYASARDVWEKLVIFSEGGGELPHPVEITLARGRLGGAVAHLVKLAKERDHLLEHQYVQTGYRR